MNASDAVPYRAVVPYLNIKGGKDALAFYRDAFAAEEVVSFDREGGVLAHAELRIGEATFMVREEYPEYGYLSPQTTGGAPINLLVYVPDTRTFTERAVAAGATLVRPIQMQFHGDLMSEIRDPFGYSWFVATRITAMAPAEIRNAAESAKL